MNFKNLFGAVFVAVIVLSSVGIYAQNVNSEQILISSEAKNLPFKEGETMIAEVKFLGLDLDNQSYYDTSNGFLLFESQFQEILLRNRFVPFFTDGKFNLEKVKSLVELCQDKAVRNGYLEAKVSAFGEELPDNQMRLIFSVNRGEAARVSEIRFTGNKNVPGEELLESFKERDENWSIFRSGHYKYCLDDSALRVIFSKGFLQAKIKEIVPKKTSDGYVVTVAVEEGVRYRIGDIKIDGAKVFSEDEILQLLGQNTGDVADGKALKDFFDEKLKRIYADKGYLLYESSFKADYLKPQRKGADAVVNFHATISEGRIYKISKISFWETEEKEAEELQRISGLKVNEIFSQTSLERALKNIDETDRFEPTNLVFSVNLTANEETGELEIEFALSKKE
jgi:outer membrane protein assembly factor BamA